MRTPRAFTCGSSNTCAMLLIGPFGTPAASSSSTHSRVLRFAKISLQQPRQLGAVLDALAVGGEARVVGELGAAGRLAELAEEVVVAAGEDHLAVGGAERLVGHDVRMQVADALGRRARREVVGVLVGEQRDLRVEQREVEVLALARCRARCASAAQMAIEAYMPVMMSATGTPARCGPPPGGRRARR